MTKISVATEIHVRQDANGRKLDLYVDQYENGVCTQRSAYYGSGYARPDGKVFRDFFAGFWNDVRHISRSLYDRLGTDEQDWLRMKGVTVVGGQTLGPGDSDKGVINAVASETLFSVASEDPFPPPIGPLYTTIAVETVDMQGAPLATTGTTVTIMGETVTSSNSPSVGSITIQVGSPCDVPLSGVPAPCHIVRRLAAVHHTTLTDLTDTFPALGAETLRIFLSREDPWTVSNALQNALGEAKAGLISEEDAQEKIQAVYRGDTVCDAALPCWIPSEETCPTEPAAGSKRGPTTCWDGSTIYAEVYDAALHQWVPAGETCPPKPECATGDKKAGYVCEGGKWVPVVFGSYDLQRRADERNVWNFPPLTLRAANNTSERAYVDIGIWLDGVYTKYYDQPLSPTGFVTFEINQYLKAGSYSNSLHIGEGTHIIETPDRTKRMEIKVWDLGREGELRSPLTCWNGSLIFQEVYRSGEWVPTMETCPIEPAAGSKRGPTTCWNGSTIYAEVYDATLHQWVSSGETCPIEPAAGSKRTPATCWDGSTIYAEVYDATLHQWVPSGERCPLKICNVGEKRGPKTCWDGSVIHTEVCRVPR